MLKTLSKNKDEWYFDLGYHIAFTSIIYSVVLIFSTVAPLITVFGALYFGIKYLIDKYNLLYIYPNEYKGQGRLYTRIVSLKYIGMVISQLIMFGLLVAIYGSRYITTCAAIVGI